LGSQGHPRRPAGARTFAGGFTTKIHAKSDSSEDIIAFDLTGGEASDATHFQTLLDIGPDITPRVAIGDKGYSSRANRAAARARHCARDPPQGQREEQAGLLRQNPPQSPHTHRQGFGRLNASSASP
jgi:hypothetical protein